MFFIIFYHYVHSGWKIIHAAKTDIKSKRGLSLILPLPCVSPPQWWGYLPHVSIYALCAHACGWACKMHSHLHTHGLFSFYRDRIMLHLQSCSTYRPVTIRILCIPPWRIDLTLIYFTVLWTGFCDDLYVKYESVIDCHFSAHFKGKRFHIYF